ncbi:YunG family protein [Actinopolyspora erythraea]|uniref:YunG family protein n=1 Tax=Actinopolyspora erythraea TaxID=414996 RepID=UPI000AC3C570
MWGDVRRGGEWIGYHWWNRLGDSLELDLTRDQFAPNELVGPGDPVSRPTGKTRLDTEYETLRKRVLTYLKR